MAVNSTKVDEARSTLTAVWAMLSEGGRRLAFTIGRDELESAIRVIARDEAQKVFAEQVWKQ